MLVEQNEKLPEKLLSVAELIPQLEAKMLQMPQVSCGVIHRFGPGIYIREVSIPADTFAIGHHQNFEQLNVMLKGRVAILNDDGSTTELKAPLIFVGKPGRKIGYIYEDMVWLNVYSTEETDIEKLEAMFLTKSDEWLFSENAKLRLQDLKSDVDKLDFKAVLNEFGFSEEQAKEQAHNEADLTSLPLGSYKIKVSNSCIEGKGLFATYNIEEGEVIAPARINGMRTIAGRYCNHSLNPNAKMIKANGYNINLVALRNIEGCKGGEDGEEITINYRDSLQLTLQLGKEG